MKTFHCLKSTLSAAAAAALAGVGLLAVQTASANPYASGITYNPTNGNVQFYLNESNATVTVTYEDGSVNTIYDGVSASATNVPAGPHTFNITNNSVGHNGYAISCYKVGNGTPFQFTADGGPQTGWNSPRGVDVNKNPKNGANFGRIYLGNSAVSGIIKQAMYAVTPDFKTAAIGPTNYTPLAGGVFTYNTASANSPVRVTVGPDDTVYVSSYSGNNAGVYAFDPNFSVFTNLVLVGQTEAAGQAAGVHADPVGVFVTGSLSTSNLVLYTFDPGLPLTYSNALYMVDAYGNPTYHYGSDGQSIPGSYNDIYKYVIGADTNPIGVAQPYGGALNTTLGYTPAPWTNSPDMGVNIGLPNFNDVGFGDVTVEPNGYVVAMNERANYSDGNVQVYDTNFNLIYTSLQPNGTDPFNTAASSYAYAGIRVSPDGQYLAVFTIQNVVELCRLVNGIPDISTLQYVTPYTTSSARGLAFDAADNIVYVSSGVGALRGFSLGYTATCVTSNDISGTNGTFSLTFPAAQAALAVTTPIASQNYTNIIPANAPISGAFTITLNTNYLPAPVTVNIALTGTATNGVQYVLNHGFDANGVYITNTTVTFPTGTFGGSGNWTATIYLTPTAFPVSGPTLTVNVAVAGGSTYIPTEPVTGSLTILNTGPQLLVVSPAVLATNMSRAVPNDYAEFIINRYGDTSVSSYTVTNFSYSGTGVLGTDFTAGPQALNPPPVDGTPGIVINTGVTSITNIIGNPVARANLYVPATNVTITLSLVNGTTGTNATSSEGIPYSVGSGTVTITEFDNAIGGEVILWSDSLTNTDDSTNWTVTYAASTLSTNTVLPVVVPNYTNNESTLYGIPQGSNDFIVLFGNPVSNDSIPVSPVMAQNGWTTALKASIENNHAAVSGLNMYPQGMKFRGNYALRFDMYLRLYDRALSNPNYTGVNDRQFATFGIDTSGTNCDWRPTAAVLSGQGSGVTNWDGLWFAIGAGINSLTPADYDAFTSPAKPNNTAGDTDFVSARGESANGIFKSPPFDSVKSLLGTFGGEPVDKWVNVSVETTLNTNIAVYINQSKVMNSFSLTNAGPIVTLTSNTFVATNIYGVFNATYTNGSVMLGYEDPLPNVSDGTAYVYYSNVRVVELSPALTGFQTNVIATNGQNVTLAFSGNFATAPLTNTWYYGPSPVVPITTTVTASTNAAGILSVPNIQLGTNYVEVFSDIAGSIPSPVIGVEVITNTRSITAYTGDTVTFTATPTGPSAPTAYRWLHSASGSGTNLVAGTHYAGTTAASLTITNVQLSDAGTYFVGVTNAYGTVTASGTLSVSLAPTPVLTSIGLSGANVVMSFGSADTAATTKSFLLLSSPIVQGPYTTNAGAVITGTNGLFQISVPNTTNGSMFYKIYDY